MGNFDDARIRLMNMLKIRRFTMCRPNSWQKHLNEQRLSTGPEKRFMFFSFGLSKTIQHV